MSEAEVEVVRRAGEAYAERGTEGVIEFLDPDLEWRTRADLPDAGIYHGHEGYRQLMARFEEVLDELYIEPVEVIDAGERVIARIRWGGKGKGSGVEIEESKETWIFTVHGGRIARVDEYASKQAALDAAGIGG